MSLVEETLFGRIDMVQDAIELLRIHEPPEGYYGATSFGKDSITVMKLAEEAGVSVDWHYSVTTIDPPELIYFGRKYYPNVIWERPPKPFFTRMLEKGFPMRVHRWCCSEYKETGGKYRRVLTGIRREESVKRANRKAVEQCLKDPSKTYINPIINWKVGDVWEFIKSREMAYCSLYDEGFRRLGCVMCPYNRKRKKEADRWPKIKALWLNAFIKLYEKNKDRPSYQKFSSGEQMFQWWLSDKSYRGNPDQMVMFE